MKGDIMSRYTGPSWKLGRRLSYSTLETGKELAKRPYGPGKAPGTRAKKQSEYGKQLTEKQKLRFTYGVSEKQFANLFVKAKAKKGVVTGTAFMQLLESRLDNLVYRIGFGRTRRAARQLVNHRHILVNGKIVDIPSYICKPGDVIAVKETSKNLKVIVESLESATIVVPYVEVNKETKVGTYIRLPERSELAKDIDDSQIVEYYNRKL
jgi:small subunit ribosomal protein S4